MPVDLFDERDFQSPMFVSVPGDGARDLRFGSRANVEAALSDHVARGAAQDTSADQRPFFIQPITLGELEHVPEEIVCCSGHDH
jgi:hypothetical protein